MLEMILNPRRSENRPWELFFVGFFYAAVSILMVHWIFGGDRVLSQYSGILVVTFAVMFSMPYVYFATKREEAKNETIDGSWRLLREHAKVIHGFLWLFLGFIIAFSVLYIALGSVNTYQAQIETYCSINNPQSYDSCTQQHGVITGNAAGGITGNIAKTELFGGIFTNNLYVLIFTIIFSLVFGAGGIFILAWNASVIAAAMVIFSEKSFMNLPLSLGRYMIHGFPEIAAYFMGTLAGGIIGFSIIRKEFKTERFWNILHDSLLLIIAAIVVLLVAALVEVYITPALF